MLGVGIGGLLEGPEFGMWMWIQSEARVDGALFGDLRLRCRT